MGHVVPKWSILAKNVLCCPKKTICSTNLMGKRFGDPFDLDPKVTLKVITCNFFSSKSPWSTMDTIGATFCHDTSLIGTLLRFENGHMAPWVDPKVKVMVCNFFSSLSLALVNHEHSKSHIFFTDSFQT